MYQAKVEAFPLDNRVHSWLLDGQSYPLFIEARENAFDDLQSAVDWATEYRGDLDQLIIEHGAIVLRGFPLSSATDFDRFISVFPSYSRGYVGGGSPRATVAGRAMEASRYDSAMKLCLHQEMAYQPTYPARIAFFARMLAESGGETTIGDMRAFTKQLPKGVNEKLDALGIKGIRLYAAPADRSQLVSGKDGKDWEESFETKVKSEVEEKCRELGLEPTWLADGGLTVDTSFPAFTNHPVTGERVYRNIIHTYHYDNFSDSMKAEMAPTDPTITSYRYGDGTPISIEESHEMHKVMKAVELKWKWNAGDLLIVDNLLVAHGREPYQGDRETLVALLD